MPINETILKNRKYRHCIDSTPGNKRWNRYSFWTHASDVEFNDGRNLQDKLGSFKGVTTNENQTAGYAADVTLVKSMKNSLSQLITSLTNLVNSINTRLGGLRFYEDSNGKWVVGADSVPKKLGSGGLDGIKKIVYKQGRFNSGKPISKTVSNDGNTITIIRDYSAGSADLASYGIDTARTEVSSDTDWAGGTISHCVIGPKIDVSKMFPNDYHDWKAENFLFIMMDWTIFCSHGSQNNLSIIEDKQMCNQKECTYNASTGTLIFPKCYPYAYESDNGGTGGSIQPTINHYEIWIIS